MLFFQKNVRWKTTTYWIFSVSSLGKFAGKVCRSKSYLHRIELQDYLVVWTVSCALNSNKPTERWTRRAHPQAEPRFSSSAASFFCLDCDAKLKMKSPGLWMKMLSVVNEEWEWTRIKNTFVWLNGLAMRIEVLTGVNMSLLLFLDNVTSSCWTICSLCIDADRTQRRVIWKNVVEIYEMATILQITELEM